MEVKNNNKKYNDIVKHAYCFREAMEIATKNGEFRGFYFLESFPKASCGEASELLRHYLYENGFKTRFICKEYYDDKDRSNNQPHAWLEYDEIIIDITGDQFRFKELFYNYDVKVYVGKYDKFHLKFDTLIHDYSEDEKNDYNESEYQIIKKYL